MSQPKNRGGKRPGAGRPATGRGTTINLSLDAETTALLAALRAKASERWITPPTSDQDFIRKVLRMFATVSGFST